MIDNEDPISAGNDDRFNEPKATPSADDAEILLGQEPPLTRIRRRPILMVLGALCALGIGSAAYALANRPHRVKAEQEIQMRPYGNVSGKPPEWTKQLELATTPATSTGPETRIETAPPSAIDTLPVTHDVPPIKDAYSDDIGPIDNGYRPPGYSAHVSQKKASGDCEDDGDLPGIFMPSPKRESGEGRQVASTDPSSPLEPAPVGLPAAPGSEQLGKIAGMLAASQGDDDDKKEGFMARAGIETLGPDEDDMSECDMSAGTPVFGNLLVATNSDVPSGNTVTLMVTKTVYCGADHEHVALPQGSKFVGEVNSRATYGQDRQQICMKQVERPASADHPRGSRKALGCFVVADIEGAPGIQADVDNHWGAVIGGSLLSAVLAMGASSSMGNQEGFAATTAQNAAHGAGNSINQSGQRIVQRELQRKPTLTTPILEGVTVMFTSNLQLDPWLPRKHHRQTY
jgi:type IV secretion system protein TrbI